MSESCVTVKITTKKGCILNENSSKLGDNHLEELIAVLRQTQQKTNDCLTTLIGERELTELEKSDSEEEEEDSSLSDDIEIETDVSRKRVKLNNKDN